MTSPNSMTWRGSMIISWDFMVYWISLMIVWRAASIPRTWATSMTWLEEVCSPTIPKLSQSKIDKDTTDHGPSVIMHFCSPYPSTNNSLSPFFPLESFLSLILMIARWMVPTPLTIRQKEIGKLAFNLPLPQRLKALVLAHADDSICLGRRCKFEDDFYGASRWSTENFSVGDDWVEKTNDLLFNFEFFRIHDGPLDIIQIQLKLHVKN